MVNKFEEGLGKHEANVEEAQEILEKVSPERITSMTAPNNLDTLFRTHRLTGELTEIDTKYWDNEFGALNVSKIKAETSPSAKIRVPIASINREGDIRLGVGVTSPDEGSPRWHADIDSKLKREEAIVYLTMKGGYSLEYDRYDEERGDYRQKVKSFQVDEKGIQVGLEHSTLISEGEGRDKESEDVSTLIDLGVIMGFDDESGRLIVQKRNEESKEMEQASQEELQMVENYLQVATANFVRRNREEAGFK